MQRSDIQPGVELYIGARLFIDHGEDDTCGGIAVVARINGDFVYFREPMDTHVGMNIYNLLSDQERFAIGYRNQIAHRCPDVLGHICPNLTRDLTREKIMEHLGEEK